MKDKRIQELSVWSGEQLRQLLPQEGPCSELEIVSGDASFRRYFRAHVGKKSYIAVDAPPQNEDSETFARISSLLEEAGVIVPRVLASDFARGFMLLDDLGDTLYLTELQQAQAANDSEHAELLYKAAIQSLLALQSAVDSNRLDPYDRKELRREMSLFEDWFCDSFLELQLSTAERTLIDHTFTFLEDAALSQIEVAVHRDYHSRNLMVLDSEKFGANCGPGVIDFQDAVRGAYSYDLVSLLRDCYISWQPQQLESWALYYFEQAKIRGVVNDLSKQQFIRDMDLMGLQRHLKVMGIFARLCIRDNKSQYLADIPLVIRYFLDVARQYPELAAFVHWFNQTVLPVANTKLKLES